MKRCAVWTSNLLADKILIGDRFSIHYEAPTSSLIIQDMKGPAGAKGVYMRPATTSWQGLG